MPEILADQHAQAAKARIKGAHAVALREIARFVEHGVGGQVEFVMYVQRFAAGQVGIGDVEALAPIPMHKADDDVNLGAGLQQRAEDLVLASVSIATSGTRSCT